VNVLIVNPLVDPATGGGMAEKAPTIARALRRLGITCAYLTTNVDRAATRPAAVADLDVTVLPAMLARFNTPLPSSSLATIDRLVATADVLLILSHWTTLHVLAYRVARRVGRPYVLLPGGALPVQGRSQLLKHVYNAIAGTRLVRDAATVIATTMLEVDDIRGYGVPADRLTIVPNAVADAIDPDADPALFRARHAIGEAPFVLFVGRLHTVKGPDLLLDAFARIAPRVPRIHLVIAGPDHGLRATLERRLASLALADRVHLVGYLDRRETMAAFRAAMMLAVPSRREAMSLVALEAGIAGTPVLLTETCGFGEVEAIGGGRVVPATVEGLAAGLDDLLSDASRLPAMGERLQTYVRAHHTWTQIAPRYADVLRRAAGDRATAAPIVRSAGA
jgi:glycosyltransferase involved in cell wall biosynthesis